ncbi:hypothetical protein SELMODRAFT_410297 [Selaginella moellendorffii]|uniref:Uncharacterized protein n=1 Tax=Selaginella moellendorffii TaxID=88036 RepID=D8REA9_SELML|nr:hypothetical protein SELMODRAFT_410297 [Selaginella moellendorffii]
MTAIGNHESLTKTCRLICVVFRDYPGSRSLYNTPDSGGECGVPYRTYFRMPVQDINKPLYSMAIGPVHFTVISTEHDWSSTSEQYAWMKSNLESVDRISVDPKFVAAVEPLLLRNKGRCLQHSIKDLAGVDFFDTTIYSAPVHAVVGMAGFSLDDFPCNFSLWSLI